MHREDEGLAASSNPIEYNNLLRGLGQDETTSLDRTFDFPENEFIIGSDYWK